MDKLLSYFLIFTMLIQTTAYAKNNKKKNYIVTNSTTHFIQLFNNNKAAFFKKFESLILTIYKSKDDQKLIKSIVSQMEEGDLEIDIIKEKDSITISHEKIKVKLSDFNFSKKSFKINKHQVEIKKNESLRETLNKISLALAPDKTVESSFYDRIIPSAHAIGIITIIALIISALTVGLFISDMLVSAMQNTLGELLSACKNSNENNKDDNLKFLKLLNDFEQEYDDYAVDEFEGVVCRDFVNEQFKDSDVTYSTSELKDLCDTSKEIMDCRNSKEAKSVKANNAGRGFSKEGLGKSKSVINKSTRVQPNP